MRERDAQEAPLSLYTSVIGRMVPPPAARSRWSSKGLEGRVTNMAALWWLWRIPLTVVVALAFMAPGVPTHPAGGKKMLAIKVNRLTKQAKKDGILRMSNTMFYYFVLEAPRNYSVVVLFTVLDQFRTCTMCAPAAKEFQILVNSWRHPSAFTNRVFFALVDYDESPEIFQMFQLRTVPKLFHFSAERTFAPDDISHVSEMGITAEQMAEWVAKKTKVSINVRRPPRYGRLAVGVLVSLLGGSALLWSWSRKLVHSRVLWAVLALSFVIVMTSGQMWTRIKGASYGERNYHTGRIHYIARMNSLQFIPETYIISLFHACITLGVVLLDKAATCRMGAIKTTMLCVTGMCLVVIFLGWLLSVFKFKQPRYPYGFSLG
uniref:Magnesium transporter protein 1 n=1 Tax=Oryctolagus cuniculus TaxID=9986 RepID=G1TYN3_RABIT